MNPPGVAEKRFIGLAAALCVGLMFGVMWGGGAPAIVFLLVGAGSALMVGACMAAELLYLDVDTRTGLRGD
jgi:hypothetical protein